MGRLGNLRNFDVKRRLILNLDCEGVPRHTKGISNAYSFCGENKEYTYKEYSAARYHETFCHDILPNHTRVHVKKHNSHLHASTSFVRWVSLEFAPE